MFQQSVDYTIEEIAYKPIKARFSSACITTNYDDYTLDEGDAQVSWMFDLDGAAREPCDPYSTTPAFPRALIRDFVSGESDTGQHGIVHNELSSGRWLVRSGTRTRADFGSPVCYLAGSGDVIELPRFKTHPADVFFADAYRQWDVYRNPALNDARREDWQQASRRTHERTHDAAVASALRAGKWVELPAGSGSPSPNISPWTGMPNSFLIPWNSGSAYPQAMALLAKDDFARLGSVMREKRFRDIKGWDAAGFLEGAAGPRHADLTQAYHEVWDPYIQAATAYNGTFTPAGSNLDAKRIDDTISRPSGQPPNVTLTPHVLDIQSEEVVYTDHATGEQRMQNVAAFTVEFRGFPASFAGSLRMRLENRVRNPNLEEPDPNFLPEGNILMWDWDEDSDPPAPSWRAMPINAVNQEVTGIQSEEDDRGVVYGKSYLYWAPEDPPAGSLWFGSERDFQWSYRLTQGVVSSQGRVKILLVHKQIAAFQVKWDLVQLAWITPTESGAQGEPGGEEGLGAAPLMGANVNFDECVDVNDVIAFVTAFENENPSADFNQDGTVDDGDIIDFTVALASGGGE